MTFWTRLEPASDASEPLLTLDEAEAQLRIVHDQDGALIGRLIAVATALIREERAVVNRGEIPGDARIRPFRLTGRGEAVWEAMRDALKPRVMCRDARERCRGLLFELHRRIARCLQASVETGRGT